MNRRGAGILLLLISAILYSTRYLAAAIYATKVSNWTSGEFHLYLHDIGSPLLVLSFVSLMVGLVYLFIAEVGGQFSSKD